jgi:hypothetical protein
LIAHLVLFAPRDALPETTRQDLITAIVRAARGIPVIRRFRVGRRIVHGLPGYEQAMRESYEYALIVEVDDLAALKAYLAHPAHAALGAHFTTSASRALAYDYEMMDAEEIEQGRWPSTEPR